MGDEAVLRRETFFPSVADSTAGELDGRGWCVLVSFRQRLTTGLYWRFPWHQSNQPHAYAKGEQERTRFLVDLASRFADREGPVLEVGCNVGRNLKGLWDAGFLHLSGIEVNRSAVRLMKRVYPEMQAQVLVGSATRVLQRFQDSQFALVFTMAVLEHIPDERILPRVARVARTLITIEDERNAGWRHFQRNYRERFEQLGMHQVCEERCDAVPGLGSDFMARVFVDAQDRREDVRTRPS